MRVTVVDQETFRNRERPIVVRRRVTDVEGVFYSFKKCAPDAFEFIGNFGRHGPRNNPEPFSTIGRTENRFKRIGEFRFLRYSLNLKQ